MIEILLPVEGNTRDLLGTVRERLVKRFGGVTMHLKAPAEGLWVDEGTVDHDDIVVIEVMTDDLDSTWWAAFRSELEERLDQEEIVIRATAIERL